MEQQANIPSIGDATVRFAWLPMIIGLVVLLLTGLVLGKADPRLWESSWAMPVTIIGLACSTVATGYCVTTAWRSDQRLRYVLPAIAGTFLGLVAMGGWICTLQCVLPRVSVDLLP